MVMNRGRDDVSLTVPERVEPSPARCGNGADELVNGSACGGRLYCNTKLNE